VAVLIQRPPVVPVGGCQEIQAREPLLVRVLSFCVSSHLLSIGALKFAVRRFDLTGRYVNQQSAVEVHQARYRANGRPVVVLPYE
jgi:hypothetical protein